MGVIIKCCVVFKRHHNEPYIWLSGGKWGYGTGGDLRGFNNAIVQANRAYDLWRAR